MAPIKALILPILMLTIVSVASGLAVSPRKLITRRYAALKSNPTLIPAVEDRANGRMVESLSILWQFSRPHTMIGSALSVLSLFMFAVPRQLWLSTKCVSALATALVPALLMNLYITGLNQIFDVDIDRINKPYLPIAAGVLTKSDAVRVVVASALVAVSLTTFSKQMVWPLQMVLLGSAMLGTVYSAPPLRLKRFPLLAALCITTVRGSLINIGFFLYAKMAILGEHVPPPMLLSLRQSYPEIVAVTAFFAVFGAVIALLKDVPDIEGDRKYRIASFSVTKGSQKMFRLSWSLLFALLSGTSIGLTISLLLTSPSIHIVRIIPAASLAYLASAVRSRALSIEAHTGLESKAVQDSERIFDFYMFSWRVFYACYMLLPLAR